ncbi:hypothetical protein XENOCAPTIV_026371, partial [Xenoophorus captivus]
IQVFLRHSDYLSWSLNDLAIREVYAKDTQANDGQCPSFSCFCQQAPTAQHGLTLLEFIPDRLSHIL